MAGEIIKMIDTIIQQRSKGNPSIANTTKAKFILKGINPDRYNFSSADDPQVIAKIRDIARAMQISI